MVLLSQKMPRVAILLSSAYGEQERLLRGILHFTQMNAPWSLDAAIDETHWYRFRLKVNPETTPESGLFSYWKENTKDADITG